MTKTVRCILKEITPTSRPPQSRIDMCLYRALVHYVKEDIKLSEFSKAISCFKKYGYDVKEYSDIYEEIKTRVDSAKKNGLQKLIEIS
ncbi:hypothetical protein J4229_02080 [Candidatus Pacearchaeota archaeon]|nr:hypothetical protein [Candidatus Pacearchaeota archaeon]